MRPVWMKLSEYLDTAYTERSRPSSSTLRKQIDEGIINGERRGSLYYVLMDADTGMEIKKSAGPVEFDYGGIVPVNEAAARVLQKALR